MVTFADVYALRLGPLHDAVTDWHTMAARLDELAHAAATGMLAKADRADWRGVNADVTKPFIAKTAKELQDAAAEAKGIGAVLADGYEAFKHAQDELKRIVTTDAPADHLTVDTTTGAVRTADPLGTRPDDGELVKARDKAATALSTRIAAVLDACDDADRSMDRALRANVGDDAHDFHRPVYDSLDAEEAARATALASKGRELSHDELEQLNELLADNSGSAVFATRFYESLGPRRALELFGQLATDTYDYTDLDEERLGDVQELQRNLGLNLATATDPDHRPHLPERFGTELRRLGTERITLGPYDRTGAFGYQLLGGIMRYGNYDARFLTPIAEHAAQLHAKNPYLFAETKPLGTFPRNPFNPSGVNGSGFDPMTSFLEALGHSPDAAKHFFADVPHAYAPDGTPVPGRADLGRGLTNYIDFFGNAKYEAFPDTEFIGEAKKAAGYPTDALGHALEAATLGHAWDDPHPKLVRDADSAAVMQQVVLKYGADAELLKHHEALADSLGNMTAGYIDDVNWGLNNHRGDSLYAPRGTPGHVELSREETRALLSALGQHPDAYATVSTAERVYATSVLEAQVGPDGHIDHGRARSALMTSSEAQGVLDQSRADQVAKDGAEKQKEFERAHEQRAAWVEFGGAAVVAGGAALLPEAAAGAVLVPLAVETGSGALEQVFGDVVGDWSDHAVDESEEKIEAQIKDEHRVIYRAGEHSAEAPMRHFIERHHIGWDSVQGVELRQAVSGGYGVGNDRAAQQGHAPVAEPS
ncbi:hypothetical protein [Streptomyces sp. NPDC093225]|uniref:hypothetical protein n=1 Tax=Streptomyces sp. NPDC093225 TaxID=3366034 RepID=UPI00381C2233